jgi:hypothetical protein
MMTARHMQLCNLCVVQLFLRHWPGWIFKPLDSPSVLLTQKFDTANCWAIFIG